MDKGDRSLRIRSRSSLLVLSGLVLGFLIVVSGHGVAPFQSSEVKFTDASASGLSIMPASCPSDPHWSGECSMPASCFINVSPSSYQSGTVNTVQVQWAAPQPGPSYDSQIAYTNATVTGIGGVFSSGTLDVAAPTASMTYTFNGAYLDTNGTVLDTFSCSQGVSVGNAPAQSLYINKVILYRGAGDLVYPGDHITYRMYVSNVENQTSLTIRDIIPAHTTLVWQGGGTEFNSGGVVGGAGGPHIWWQHQNVPHGTQFYVDFTVRVNANAPSGAQVCNTATVSSNEVGAVSSNQICNTVAACTTPLDAAVSNIQGYKAAPYSASGKRADKNTVPICVTNTSGNNYFIPANTSYEIEQFKAKLPPGASYQNI